MSRPMPLTELAELVTQLKAGRGFAHKRDISDVVTALAQALPGGLASTTLAAEQGVLLGDDCAAIPDADGHLLLAIEGLVEDFVAQMPWFAGYSGVMVNLSDIAAMGGRPIAVVDALWSNGQAGADPVLQGMAAASAAYGVPIVGGHSNNRAPRGQLAVAVLGRAKALLSSFKARAGQHLVMLVDLRGHWEQDQPFWNASTGAPAERLRSDLALLPDIAEAGWSEAAKDISMAGILGTALMLLECSQVGCRIQLDAIPHPPGHGPLDSPAAWLRWLQAFPSFGYLLSVDTHHLKPLMHRCQGQGLTCAVIGQVDDSREVWLTQEAAQPALLWNFKHEPFIGPKPAMEAAA
jgi:uncharacterized protein